MKILEKLLLLKEEWFIRHYTYFKKYYKMIAVELSKQQALDADPKAI